MQTFSDFLEESEEKKIDFSKFKTRQKVLDKIYTMTHKDYKGKFQDGEKSIMVMGNSGGATLVGLSKLTDEQILSKLQYNKFVQSKEEIKEMLKKLK